MTPSIHMIVSQLWQIALLHRRVTTCVFNGYKTHYLLCLCSGLTRVSCYSDLYARCLNGESHRLNARKSDWHFYMCSWYQQTLTLKFSLFENIPFVLMEKEFSVTYTSQLITLNVRGPSYLGLTRSISWLLMPWLLTSPWHQQPWYWLCRTCRSWSYMRKDFKYLCHIDVD